VPRTFREHAFNYIYGGGFQNAINVMYSPDNIVNTAAQVRELETPRNLFEPGKFVLKLLDMNRDLLRRAGTVVPADFNSAAFNKDFSTIPTALRRKAAVVMRANFYSDNPLPMLTKVSENVDQTHDVVIKPFVDKKGILYIGILFLCPNTSPVPA
jgi:hypothetical protein